MLFYHYTSRTALESILREGLTQGEAPISEDRFEHAINLTTDPSASGHGLDHGGHIVSEEEAALYARHGHRVPAGTAFANKRAARITLMLGSSDPKLKPWTKWSRKHCKPGYPEALEKAAGGRQKAKTWWLYFGVIPPSTFTALHLLDAEGVPETAYKPANSFISLSES